MKSDRPLIPLSPKRGALQYSHERTDRHLYLARPPYASSTFFVSSFRGRACLVCLAGTRGDPALRRFYGRTRAFKRHICRAGAAQRGTRRGKSRAHMLNPVSVELAVLRNDTGVTGWIRFIVQCAALDPVRKHGALQSPRRVSTRRFADEKPFREIHEIKSTLKLIVGMLSKNLIWRLRLRAGWPVLRAQEALRLGTMGRHRWAPAGRELTCPRLRFARLPGADQGVLSPHGADFLNLPPGMTIYSGMVLGFADERIPHHWLELPARPARRRRLLRGLRKPTEIGCSRHLFSPRSPARS